MLESYALWSEITEPGDAIGGLLRRHFGVEQSLELVRSDITAKSLVELLPKDEFLPQSFPQSMEDSLECWRRRLSHANPALTLERIGLLGGELITPASEFWPAGLNDLLDHAPAALWVLGDPAVFQQTAISVIGARLASDYGLQLTADIVRFCVSQEWLIVSGGALGIDARASSSALENGGKAICVMAGGLDRLYPSANLELFHSVRNSGAIISELPPQASPSRWRFLQRNRLIAALGKATVVVEAGFRSGSINTAGHANQLCRPVGAIPGRVDSVRSAGCHRLIREQRAELIATPSQLAELMGFSTADFDALASRNDNQIRILDALQSNLLTSEAIARISGMTILQTESTLRLLAKERLVQQMSEGWQKL